MKPISPRRLVRTGSRRLALALVSLLAAASAPASNIYWDGTSTDWTMVGSWSTASGATAPDPALVPGAGDIANFSISTITNTAQTVNLNAGQAVAGLVFLGTNTATTTLSGGGTNQVLTLGTSGITVNASAGAVTIGSATGGQNVAITLGGAQTWTNNSANTLTIQNALTNGANLLTIDGTGNTSINGVIGNGAGGIAKNGAGVLTLTGANTFTGATNINVGALNIQHATALGTTAAGTTVATGAALQIQNNITVGNEALTLSGDGIGATGALRNISGNNTWQGTVTLAGATTLQSDAGTLTFNTAATSITGTNNLTIQGAGGVTISGATTGIDIGTGTLTKNNAGTLTLTGPSSYSGATLINGGVVNISNANSLGTVAGGVTVASGAALQMQGGFTVGGKALSLSGTGISNDGALRNLSGANTWQGTVTLAAATRINSDAGSLTFDTAANSITGTQNLTLGGAAGGSVNGTITTGTGTLTKDGAGTWTLAGANTYTGLTTITTGTLLFGKRSALYTDAAANWTTSNLSVASAAVLGIGLGDHGAGYFDTTDLATLLDGSHLGASTASTGLKTGAILGLDTTNATAGTFTYNTAIANTGNALNLAKLGAGILTLSASNTYTGTTNLSVGTLKAGILGSLASGAFGTNSAVTMAAGTTLDITGFNTWIGSLTGNGTVTLGAATLSVGGDNTNPAAYAGAINGGGGLTKIGSGTLTLSGTNGYTGATTLSEGTLSVSATGNLGGTNSLAFDGGTLQVTGTSLTAFGTHTPTFNPGKTAVFDISTSNNTFTASQIFNQGSGGLTKLGSGTLKLSGTNTFSGQLTVKNGALSVATVNNDSSDGPLGNNALAVILGNAGSQNGTLQYTGGGTVASNKKFTLATDGSGTFQVDTAGTILTLSGAIDGSGNLIKTGAGTLVLSGTNTYTGTTTVNTGSISFGADNLLPATQPLVLRANTNAGAVIFDLNGHNQTVGGIIASAQDTTGSVEIKTGSGLLTTTGDIILGTTNTFTITYSVISGNLSLGGGIHNVDTGSNSPSQISAVISNGGLIKLGGTSLLLSGANTYSLGTTVNAGYIRINSAAAGPVGAPTSGPLGTGFLTFNGGGISSDSATARTILNPITFTGTGLFGDGTNLGQLTLSANADLGGSARVLTVATNTTAQFDGIMSNGGIAKNGTGTLVLANAANSYAGGTTVNTGTLKLGVANALQGAVSLFASPGTATLDLNGLNTTISTLSMGAQSGTDGPVTVNTGAGILTLGGDFTFAGTTNNPVGGIINGNLSLGSATRQFLMTAHSTNAANVNGDIYIPAIISGSSGVGLTVGGSSATGVLTLSGANTYTGNTTLANAILRVGSAENAGVAGPLGHPATPAGSIIFNGGILQYSSGNQFDYSSRFSNAASQQYKADTNGQSVIWASALTSSAGTLTKSGSGTLELSGTNTYSGTTTVSAGTLVLSGNNSGSISPVTIALGGIGQFNSLISIPGSGKSVTDTGTLVFGPAFGAANIPAGLARITTGSTGVIAIDNYLGTNFDLNAAGLTAASLGSLANATYSGTLTPQGGVYRLGGGGGTLTLGNVNALTGANAAVISNSVILAALNNNTGTTTINASATLTLGTGVTGQNGSVGGNISNSGTLVINDFDAQTYGGVISGTGPLTKTAAGAFTLSAPQTYTGTTTVNAGTLLLAGGNHTLAVNKPMVVNTGGTLDLGSNNQYVGQFSGSGGVVTGSGGRFTTNPTGAASFAGSIQGSVNLVKVGNRSSKTLTLTGDNTTSGTVSLVGGDIPETQGPDYGGLKLVDAGRLSATTALTLNNGSLFIDNSGTANDNTRVNDSATVSLNGGRIIYAGRASTASTEAFGNVTATSGMGTITTTAGSSGSAVLTINSLTRNTGATLQLDGTNLGTSGNNSRILISTALAGNLTSVNGVIPGVFKGNGGGSNSPVGYVAGLGFAAVGTAGGFPTTYGGTLASAAATDNVVNASAWIVKAGGQTINSMVQSGNITFGNASDTLTIGSGMICENAQTSPLIGTSSVRGQLTSGLGTGELFLIRTNEGSGGAAGTLQISAVIIDNGDPASGGTRVKLILDSYYRTNLTNQLFNLTATNTYTGGTVASGGNETYLNSAGTTIPAANDPAQGLIINNSVVTMQTYAQQIAASNIVTLNGGSTLTLFGANTLAGLVFNSNGGKATPTVTGGTLLTVTGNISSTPTDPTVTPLIGTVPLDLNGTSAHDITVSALPEGNFANNLTPLNGLAISSVIQNGGFTKKGDGVLNLTANNTFTGDLTVQEGVVNVATFNETSAAGPLGKSTNAVVLGGSGGKTGVIEYSGGNVTSTRLFTLATGGTGGFQVDAAGTTLTLSGQIDGSGGLAKTGAGTLILSSAKTYSGNTTVKAGTLKLEGAGSFANSPNIIVGDTAGSTAVLDVSNKTGGFTVGSTQTLGGCGVINGTVNVSGVLAPGASIETLACSALNLNNLSTFAYEVNSSVAATVGADLLKVGGALNLTGTVTLSLTDIAASPVSFATGTTFSLINYTGGWNSGLFTIGGTARIDEAQFFVGNNTWQIDYNATSGGSNFSSEQVAGNFVNLTAMGGLIDAPKMVVLDPNQADIPNPGAQAFGTAAVGSSNSLTLTIKNTGKADLILGSIYLDGSNPSEFTVTTAPASPVVWATGSNTTTFTVKFSPAGAGDRQAILHIPNNDTTTFDINLSGTGSNPYQDWIDGYTDLMLDERVPGADPDHDGSNNLAEFAFNGVPNNPAKKGLFVTQLKDNGGDLLKELTFTCAVRRSATVTFPASGVQTATIDGVTYLIEANPIPTGTWSSPVTYIGKSNTAPAGSSLPDLTGTAWEYCTFSAFNGLGGKGFLHAKVTLP